MWCRGVLLLLGRREVASTPTTQQAVGAGVVAAVPLAAMVADLHETATVSAVVAEAVGAPGVAVAATKLSSLDGRQLYKPTAPSEIFLYLFTTLTIAFYDV